MNIPIPPKPYAEWDEEPEERAFEVERALGISIHETLTGNLPILKKLLSNDYPDVNFDGMEPVLRKVAWYGVYYAMMALDGVAGSSIDESTFVRWKVDAEIHQHNINDLTETVENVNVLPNGYGLCYAYHDWYDIKETESDTNEEHGA